MRYLWLAALLYILPLPARGFSLLGPFEPWQTPALGYNALGNDVGAPKNLGEEYRWNVPVITYGFDRSFIDFFGNAGIAAVDAAFHVFNSLPPASEIVHTNFPLEPRPHPWAEMEDILDLKSAAMGLIIEQLGLADPERYTWTLRDRKVSPEWTNYSVIMRNFDPLSHTPTPYVNERRYTYDIAEFHTPAYADALDVTFSPIGIFDSGTAASTIVSSEWGARPGVYFTFLSSDDAAGLRYLLVSDNLNFERLPSGVQSATSGEHFVNEAIRPGIEKLTFQKISAPWDTTTGWKQTLSFTDHFYDEFGLRQQNLTRTITRPDFVFSAADLGTVPNSVALRQFGRTTPNWTQPGSPNLPGPGTLQGPVTITFAKLTGGFYNHYPGMTSEESVSELYLRLPRWGYYPSTSLPLFTFPLPQNESLPSHISIQRKPNAPGILQWQLASYPHVKYELQSSTDLIHWQTLHTFTPTGMEASGEVPITADSQLFLRAYAKP